MKNPIKPTFKSEIFSWLLVVSSFVLSNNDYFSWAPCLILLTYALFLFLPYLPINRQESAHLQATWHKVKDLSLAYLLSVQVVIAFIFPSYELKTIIILIILWLLFAWSLWPSLQLIKKYRKKHGNRSAFSRFFSA